MITCGKNVKQASNVVAKTMDKAGLAVTKIARLHKGTNEIHMGYIHCFPRTRQRREPIVNSQSGRTGVIKETFIKLEASAADYMIVFDLLRFIGVN